MLKTFEKAYIVLTIIYLTPAIVPIFVSEEFPVDVNLMSDARLLVLQLTVWAGFLFFAYFRFNGNAPIRLPQTWVTALVLWAVLSVSWSTDPSRSLKKVGVDIVITAFGLFLANNFTLREELKMLQCALTICAVLTIAWYIGDPQWAVMKEGALSGSWRGVFGHKNVLGKNMVLLCYCSAYLWRVSSIKERIGHALIFFLGLGLLILSRSGSSLIEFAFLVAAWPFFRLLKMKASVLVSAAVGLIGFITGLALVIVPNLSIVLGLMGKKSDLTGRTELWSAVIDMISIRPWLGYGHRGFWAGTYGPSINVIEKVGWSVVHAHNGLLEVALDLGLIGVSLFLMAYLMGAVRAVRAYRSTNGEELLWPLLFLMLYALSNVAETTILRGDLFWILFVSATSSARLGARAPLAIAEADDRPLEIPRGTAQSEAA